MLAVCPGCEIGAKGAASLALQLKHLGQLQSLNLTSKPQGSGWCVQRVGLGGRGWYLRGSPVAALCSVGVLGAGAWCLCWDLGILMCAAMFIVC